MQSKLSKYQKDILIIVYETKKNIIDTSKLLLSLEKKYQPTNKKSFVNIFYKSLKSLIKRELIKNISKADKYTKKVTITLEGANTVEQLRSKFGNEIILKLKAEKLLFLLKKLMVLSPKGKDIMFPSPIFHIQKGTLYSVEKEEHNRALRLIRVSNSFFDKIQGDRTIKINGEKIYNFIKKIKEDEEILIETQGDRILLHCKTIKTLNYKLENLPNNVLISPKEANLEFKDGFPLIGTDKIQLDVHFIIKSSEIRKLKIAGEMMKSEFYTFLLNNKKLFVRIGNLHESSDYAIQEPKCEILSGNQLEVTLTYGIDHIVYTFDRDVVIKTKSNAPAIFSEKTDDYDFNLLIPPYVNE